MVGFTIVWIGQVVSLLGTQMTWFALTIWAYGAAGEAKATALALVGVFSFGPTVVLSPIAGALVDRWDRKLVMVLSDLASGLMTCIVLLLYATGNLEIWHLYVTGAISGAFQSFQFPAYSAAVSTMLPKEQYARASGMMSLAEGAAGIFGPMVGGILLTLVGIAGIMAIDVATFLVAIGALLVTYIPRPKSTEAGRAGQGNLLKESLYGFRYIVERPSLLGLQLVFLATNLTAAFAVTVLAPMILARTSSDEIVLGSVQSAMGAGGLVSSLLLSVWGGPKRRVHGVLLGMAFGSLLGQTVLGLGTGVVVWAVGAFLFSFCNPIINGSNQAIWQAKVAPDVQGRVFATRLLIAQISFPVTMLVVGPVADFVFEPAMMPGGALTGALGWLVGPGPGAGMGILCALAGILGTLISLGAYAFRAVRDAEDILPDHDAAGHLEEL
ncbi:MAG: MFS transporter [Anaerolineae bacterium]|nr:MFS transporter [Anaerolineae bacterium]